MVALSVPTIAALTIEGAAIAVVVVAGRLYVRGEIERSRPIARRAGFAAGGAALAGTGLLAFAHGAGLAALVDARSLIGAALLTVAGAAALLGGLSGKPRPAGEVAALLWCAALVALVWGW